MLDKLFPYGWVDVAMWLTVPFWAWTLWIQEKKNAYWFITIWVCLQWGAFAILIKCYPSLVLNILCTLVTLLGYRRFRNGK